MSDLNRRLGSSHLMTRANTVEKKLGYVLNSRIHGYHKPGSYCSVSSVLYGPTKSGILKTRAADPSYGSCNSLSNFASSFMSSTTALCLKIT